MITQTQSISAFLTANTVPDLAQLYHAGMEVQVTVARDNGTRIEGDYKGRQWLGYSDGIQTWKPLRIPYNAKVSPEYEDRPMTWDLAAHAEGIGMTGWDWQQRKSIWVAYDFDAILGHSEKHAKKLTDDELTEIRRRLWNIPSVAIRQSTGGRGLHVYVFLDNVATANHTEHAAVARAVLSQLSGVAGFDFNVRVDTCGSNIWVWHRKMASTNGEGLKLLKSHTSLYTCPVNWRDHLSVVEGKRVKNLPSFIPEAEEDLFSQISGQRIRIPLDATHKKIIEQVIQSPSSWWDAEHYMLVTHTVTLKEAHQALDLRGQFETISTGRDRGADINCFCYPLSDGGFSVYRYTQGVQEHCYWQQDGKGWTRTVFNRNLTLQQAVTAGNGVEDPNGGFWFANISDVITVARLLGIDLGWPQGVSKENSAVMKIHKSGKLLVTVNDYKQGIVGWKSNGKKIERMFSIDVDSPESDEVTVLDKRIRHLVSEEGEDCGWVINTDGEWHSEPINHVEKYLRTIGYKAPEIPKLLGSNIAQCWKLVNIPFKDEYPRDRQWNRNAAKLRYRPSLTTEPRTPTWNKVLDHLGSNLTSVLPGNEWCVANSINTGSDWLRCWIASMFQEPGQPLPYIFFYGGQDTGKSIFHESLALLMTRGVVRADQALVSPAGFNGELDGAVLCVIEETDLRVNKLAYNRIKDWVTSKSISIHKKGKQPYMVPNTAHFVQTSNDHQACPIFAGDTRITLISVPPLTNPIPKKELLSQLEAEAADFLAAVLSLELPKSGDRLNIPCITTHEKIAVSEANKSMLEQFLSERCYYVPGAITSYSDFYEKFAEWIDPTLLASHGRNRIARDLPPHYPKGRNKKTWMVCVGNLSFEPTTVENPTPWKLNTDGVLVQ